MKKIILVFLAMVLYIHVGKSQSQKVGINTLTPEETLHVIGDIILLESPDGTKKIMLRTAGGDGELKSLGDLYLRSQGNDIIMNHVPTDGNVGIGTISASEKLTVEGAIKVGTSGNMTNDAGTLKFESGDFLGYDGSTWKSFTNGGSSVWTESGSNVYYLGSVGVNTTSPNADLHVVGDSLLLQSPDGTKNLLFRNAGADSEVKSIGDLYIRGQGNDVIINHVASDGNVGIGTGSPMEQLDINGAIKIGTTILDNTGTIRFEGGDFEGYDGTEWKSLTSGGGGVWDENGTSAYYNGSVGINTANPNADLHVVGDTLLFQSPDGTKNLLLRNAGADSEIKSIGDLYLRGQGNDVIINHVAADGNVGIGTGAPSEKLDVDGGVRIGSTTSTNSGTLRFESGEFEGYDGTVWKNLTNGGGVWTEDGNIIHYTGSVGINTTTPTADLHVVGDTFLLQSTDGTKNLLLRNAGADSEIKSIGDLYLRGQGNEVIINHAAGDGNVGIGTGITSAKLHLDGNFKIGDDQIDFIEQDFYTSVSDGYGRIKMKDETDNNRITINASSTGDFEYDPNQASIVMKDNQANERLRLFAENTLGGFYIKNHDSSDNTDKTLIYAQAGTYGTPILGLKNVDFSKTVELRGDNWSGGRIDLFGESSAFGAELVKIVAKESADRGARMTMKSDDGTQMIVLKTAESSDDIPQGIIELHNSAGTRTIKIDGQAALNAHSHISLYKADGTKSIEINSNWNNEGDSRIETDELQINGGSDFAEHFDIIEETLTPTPGMVVSIDPNSTGKLTITKESYDRKVAGIISGANGVETGLFMGQKGSVADGDFPIALTGRVYVYANDEGGVIQPGDLLTTSSTKGYAMKVEDYSRAQGAIIGKAMTTIDENGFVLVLVNLQ